MVRHLRRMPRLVRWLLILAALYAGWMAGDLLDNQTAAKDYGFPASQPVK